MWYLRNREFRVKSKFSNFMENTMIYETVCDIGSTHETILIEATENQLITRDCLLLRGKQFGAGKRIGRFVKVEQTTNQAEVNFKVIEELWIDCSQVSLDEYMAKKVEEDNSAEIITTDIVDDKVKIYKLN